MLVLSRIDQEKIVFPTLGISIQILHVARNKVCPGIDAPSGIPIQRSEVAERIFREELRHEHPR